MRTVSIRIDDLERYPLIPIGFAGENEYTTVNIDCMKVFNEHPAAIPVLVVKPPKGDSYPAIVVRNGNIVSWTVTDSDLIYDGEGELQLSFTINGTMIGKTNRGRTMVQKSILPSGEVPTPIENWLIEAGETLAELEEAVPSGGTTGQVLKKKSDDDYDTEWAEDSNGVQIDDAAGIGDTDVTWSANKSATELNGKADKADPVFTGKMSMGRKSETTEGTASVALGMLAEASGDYSFCEGSSNKASGNYTHAEGNGTTASNTCSHAEGSGTTASGAYAHAEGGGTIASKSCAHAEGGSTTASGSCAHAEGSGTTASGSSAHAEGGSSTTASGSCAHAEGGGTTASGSYAHAEGGGTTASGTYAHAEGGGTTASGACAHAEGGGTTASGDYQHVSGKNNVIDNLKAEIIGNGSSTNNRSNARSLDWNGNEYLKGDLYIHCNADSSGGIKVAFPAPPTSDGTYKLTCVISNGNPTYSWVIDS